MVNTATDEVGGNDGAGGTNANIPTQVQGWGRVNLQATSSTAPPASSSTRAPGRDASGQRQPPSTGSPARPSPLKVTLRLDRRPGTDLRQRVRQRPRPDRRTRRGQSYKGNVFAGGQSRSRRQRPTRATTSRTSSCPPAFHGPFTVDVHRHQHRRRRRAGQRGHHRSGLRAGRLERQPGCQLPGAGRTTGLDDTRSATATAFSSPGEVFRLTERLRNLGTATRDRDQRGALRLDARDDGPDRRLGLSEHRRPRRARHQHDPVPGQARRQLRLRADRPGDARPGDHRAGQQQVPVRDPDRRRPGPPSTTTAPTSRRRSPTAARPVRARSSTSAATAKISDLNVRVSQITHTFDGDLVICADRSRRHDGAPVQPAGRQRRQLHRHGLRRRGGDGDLRRRGPVHRLVPARAAALRVRRQAAPTGRGSCRSSDVAGDDTGTLSGWGLTRRSPRCN